MILPSVGFLKKKDSRISGEIYDSQNKEEYKIAGTWNEEIQVRKPNDKKIETVVRLTPFHDSFYEQYCFTQF
jgi:hypothetical protein